MRQRIGVAKVAFVAAIAEAFILIAINELAITRDSYVEGTGIVPSGVAFFSIALVFIIFSSILWILFLLVALIQCGYANSQGGKLMLAGSFLVRICMVSAQLYVIFSTPHYH